MAFGVEARVPFLDYRLVEYVFSAANWLRIEDGLSKRVLRQAVRGVIPEEVRNRRDKIGFNTPEAAWFRGPARAGIEDLLRAPTAQLGRYLRTDRVRELAGAFLDGAPLESGLIWRWVNLELWLRTFVATPRRAAVAAVR